MSIRRKKPKDKMISLRIPVKLLNEYRLFCEENSINMSQRLRKYMERDLENWKKKIKEQLKKERAKKQPPQETP